MIHVLLELQDALLSMSCVVPIAIRRSQIGVITADHVVSPPSVLCSFVESCVLVDYEGTEFADDLLSRNNVLRRRTLLSRRETWAGEVTMSQDDKYVARQIHHIHPWYCGCSPSCMWYFRYRGQRRVFSEANLRTRGWVLT